jgi:hypothetical protein
MIQSQHKIFEEADKIMKERHKQYGDYRNSMQRAAATASMITSKHFTAYDVAMIMFAVKLARINQDKNHHDSWIDGLNYFVMASELSNEKVDNQVIELSLKKVSNDVSAAINS